MKSHCLPFRQVPQTTQLFLDYLDFTPNAQQFYPRPPRFLEWAKEEASRINYPADRRARVTDILERQNKAWGASAKTFLFLLGNCYHIHGNRKFLVGHHRGAYQLMSPGVAWSIPRQYREAHDFPPSAILPSRNLLGLVTQGE